MPRPLIARIDPHAMEHNLAVARARLAYELMCGLNPRVRIGDAP